MKNIFILKYWLSNNLPTKIPPNFNNLFSQTGTNSLQHSNDCNYLIFTSEVTQKNLKILHINVTFYEK